MKMTCSLVIQGKLFAAQALLETQKNISEQPFSCRHKLREYVNPVSVSEEIDTNSLENGIYV